MKDVSLENNTEEYSNNNNKLYISFKISIIFRDRINISCNIEIQNKFNYLEQA